jgi:3-dehydroquinate synthase
MRATAPIPRVQPIMVELGERTYPIYIAQGLIERVGPLLRERLPSARRSIVVTSEVIHKIHGRALTKSLDEAGVDVGVALVPDGEEAKSWSSADVLIGELLERGLDRLSIVVAFGGGTVGDLSGFVASIFLRGVSLIQVPTSLLAQVDSSIGGKVAINHPKGKNLIGSFHQPAFVVSDPNLLGTLPRRELLSGLGEIVKHGMIADQDLFKYIEVDGEKLVNADPEALTHVVRRSAVIKARLVGLDERDTKGIRAILNYGHTVGHALETLLGIKLRHGEAVAIGMCVAACISERMGFIEKEDVVRQKQLLERLGFELEPPPFDASRLIEVMHRDKKVEGKSIRFVLPTGIGKQPVLMTVPDHLISQILEDEGFD